MSVTADPAAALRHSIWPDSRTCGAVGEARVPAQLLLQAAHAEKVLPSALSAAGAPGLDPRIGKAFKSILERQSDWVEKVLPLVPENCVLLKGPTIEWETTAPRRYFADIDVLAPTLECAARFGARLAGIGLVAAPVAFVRYSHGGQNIEAISMRYVPPRATVGFAGVEVHVGAFPIRPESGVAASWLFARALPFGGHGAQTMSLNRSALLCLVLANFCFRKRVRLRDLLDVQALAYHVAEEGEDEVLAFAREYRLDRSIAKFLHAFSALEPRHTPAIITRLGRELPVDSAYERAPLPTAAGKSRFRGLVLRLRAVALALPPRSAWARACNRLMTTKLAVQLFRNQGIVLALDQRASGTDYVLVAEEGGFRLGGRLTVHDPSKSAENPASA